MVKKLAPTHVAKKAELPTLRCVAIRTGTVASSPIRNCTPTKAISSTPKRTNSAMIRPSLHAYVVLLYCSASRRQMLQGRKIVVPIGSKCMSFYRSVSLASGCSWRGSLKKKTSATAVTAPIGTSKTDCQFVFPRQLQCAT
jgi:hypothetical protein